MNIWLLTAIWILIGVLAGALACGAKLRPISWGNRGWLYMLAVGVGTALLGGWIGTLLLGPQFATVTVIWIAVLGVVLFPLIAKYRI
jgi:uncharacterized membrane protein YeaQ/YmgE (transglycosylase-associated protein family)